MGNVFLLSRGTNLISHHKRLSRVSLESHTVGKKIRLRRYSHQTDVLHYILYTTVMFPFFLSLLETKTSLIIRENVFDIRMR